MKNLDHPRIVKAVRVAASSGDILSLHEPCFKGNEWQYAKACLDSGWVSSVGEYVDRFERMLAGYTKINRAIAVVNGTAALHVSLIMADIRPGDEVLLPALTFVATANAVAYFGAVPHFIDSDAATMGVDPKKLEEYLSEVAETCENGCRNRRTGSRIRALVPVHIFGHPADLDALVEVCAKFNLFLIEDAAESLGSLYKGRHTGAWGRCASLSFNGNKIVTTGGGGAILTNDEKLADRIKHLTTTAKLPHPWEYRHDRVGYNYRLPNINAALGCAQMEKLPDLLRWKRALACRYEEEFRRLDGIRFFKEPSFAESNYWLNTLLLDPETENARDELLAFLHRNGILARPAWTLMHKLSMYENCPRMDLSTAESLERRIINIPSSPHLGAAHD